jgi:hypothetical protein
MISFSLLLTQRLTSIFFASRGRMKNSFQEFPPPPEFFAIIAFLFIETPVLVL